MSKTLRTVLPVAVLLSLVACAAPSDHEDAASEETVASTSQALTSLSGTDWMNQMPGLATKKLTDISFPATHDSGTYGLVSVYDRPADDAFAPDAESDLVKAGQFIGMTDAWAKAQEKSIKEQLEDGIRAIDLRPCREKSGTLRICHGMYGPTMSDLLGQVKTFSDAHPRELVIVNLASFAGMEDADHTTLADLVKSKLGSRLLDASRVTIGTTTMGDVWNANAGSVLVIYDSDSSPSTSFFTTSAWQNSWVDTWDRDRKKSSLESAFTSQKADQLFWFSGQATPDSDLITKGLNFVGSYPSTLAKLADQTNPVVMGWVVNEWSGKRLNVMAFDFYNRTCLVKVAQNRNGASNSLDGCSIGTTTSWGHFADAPYGRGAGTPLQCASTEQSVAGLCYTRCASGYSSPTGFPTVCAQACPSGYRDDGLTCFRDASIVSANNSSCPWYDKCGLTLSKGCSTCPSGYSNDGCTCRRDAKAIVKTRYDRGVGRIPSSCASGNEKDGALCYPKCKEGYHGVGPMCWPG